MLTRYFKDTSMQLHYEKLKEENFSHFESMQITISFFEDEITDEV